MSESGGSAKRGASPMLRGIVALIATVIAWGALGTIPAGSALAQSAPACDDGIDNDADGSVDWFEDADCHDDPAGTSESPAACADGVDNDGDAAIDTSDPGCAGDASDADETDPAPVASAFAITRLRPDGCGVETAVRVFPDLRPKRLFPFDDVTITVRGIRGRARGINRTHRLPLKPDSGYGFTNLRPGRYEVTGRYPGDRYRLASSTRRHVTLSMSRCRVYFTGSGFRRYKPGIAYFGASQRILGIQWRQWGGRVARGNGTYPVDDCIPNCAAGSITDYPVAVELSQRRVCNGYVQYLRMRRTYVGRGPWGSPHRETVNFGYICD